MRDPQLFSLGKLPQWQSLETWLDGNEIEPEPRRRIEKLCTGSQYAMRILSQNPDRVGELIKLSAFELTTPIVDSPEQQTVDSDRVKQQLRQYRHRKLVEIIYLDINGLISLDQSLRALSDLSEQLIDCAVDSAYRQLCRKHGQPLDDQGEAMRLNVIAMGKLGGRELNFSSDIDLICAYPGDGELSGYGQLSHQEFFTRQVRLMSQMLADNTADGFVYRVDLRLRPWGESGPVVLSHAAMEHYYQLHGREWEQYAMVKARVICGSDSDRRQLSSMIKPFVYRKYHDYRVFEGLAALKDKIDAQAKSRDMSINIKIGQGGIREIEFFVQAFQILKGGRNQLLQSPGIATSFDALETRRSSIANPFKNCARPIDSCADWKTGFKMLEDQQTHDLPSDPVKQARIAFALDAEDWQQILEPLRQHQQQVNHCFTELFKSDSGDRQARVIDDSFSDAGGDRRWDFITEADLEGGDEINARLNSFLESKSWSFMSTRARQRFDALMPGLIETLKTSDQPVVLFQRMLRLFSSIAGRSVYFELLVQNRALLTRLASLFDQSDWIASEVSQYPMLLENLIQPGDRDRFDKTVLLERLLLQLDNVSGDDELELDSLRIFKREQTLVIASAELAGEIDASEVGRYLSELAEVVLEAVYRLASRLLQSRHGLPRYHDQDDDHVAELAIVGYGKLGGYELHYQSDLDVIFLHNSRGERQFTDGDKCIENSVYFGRLAQKIISMTSLLTASGNCTKSIRGCVPMAPPACWCLPARLTSDIN